VNVDLTYTSVLEYDNDDAVTDDANVHEGAETTPVMSTSTSNNDEWLFNGVNISVLFCQYQVAVRSLVLKHGPLPPADYCNDITSLFNVFILNAGQHSDIATKVFGVRLLNDLTASLHASSMDYSMDLPDQVFITFASMFADLAMGSATCDDTCDDPLHIA
jgi:hypothetical protein